MHQFRSAANDRDEPRSWNPFGKLVTKHDEENAERTQTTRSENLITSQIEQRRRSMTPEGVPKRTNSLPLPSKATNEKPEHIEAGSGDGSSLPGQASPDARKRELPTLLRVAFDRIEQENSETRRSKERDQFKIKGRFTASNQIRATIFNSWINILLLMVPAGFAVRYTKGPSLSTFLVNFFAIIPLSGLAEYSIAELILRIGENWGGLAYITISNFVQIVSCIFLLRANQLDLLQTNLIGGILTSVLLILGLSIFFGGLNRMEQHFNLTVAHLSANLLSLAATSLLIPTASHLLLQTSEGNVIRQSRGATFVLLIVYAAFLVFQFYSHVNIWGAPNEKVEPRSRKVGQREVIKGIAQVGAGFSASMGGSAVQETPMHEPEEEVEIPQLSVYVLAGCLVIVSTLTAFCTQFAIDSIDALSQKANISKPFIGLVLLPILNNDLTPINHAIKDNLHQTMNYTIGKCLQTALFVTPVMVLVAWGMHLDLTLNFDGFEVVSLFASVLLINYLIIDGKSSW